MPTYRIMNHITKQWWEGDAESAQEACQKAGWPIGNCWVRARTPVRSDPSTDSGHVGGGWRNITPGKPRRLPTMSKLIDQLVDNHGHLIEFIHPCQAGQTLVRWFSDPLTLKTQQLLPKESADWVKQGLLRNGYHQT